MSTYNNLGTVEMWKSKMSALYSGKPTSPNPQIIDYDDSYLKRMNNLHGRFMDKVVSKTSEAEQILINANRNYGVLMSGVEKTINLVEKSEQNGNVESEKSDAYNSKSTQSSNLTSNTLMEKPERTSAKEVVAVSSSLASNTMSDQNTSSAATISAVSGVNIGSMRANSANTAQAATISSVSNSMLSSTKSISSHNSFGTQNISGRCWKSFSSEEQIRVFEDLKTVGYSNDEIKMVVSGFASVPVVEVAALDKSLQGGLAQYPELRQDLINQYGFDIFNDDGSVDGEKLAMILLIDQKNDDDVFDLIEYLHAKYEIDIVSQEKYDQICHVLEELDDKFEQIRLELVDRYGFDIFNKDKTVNRERLTLALLMDDVNKNDEFDLLDFLLRVYDDEKNNIVKLKSISTLSEVSLQSTVSDNLKSLSNNSLGDEIGKESGE